MNADSTRRYQWRGALALLVLLALVVWTVSGDPPRPQRPEGVGSDPTVPPILPSDPQEAGNEGAGDGKAAVVPVIMGTVWHGEDDEPLAGATVTAHDRSGLCARVPWLAPDGGHLTDFRPPGPAIARTRSAADGSFVLRLPRHGIFAIRAAKEGIGESAGIAETGSVVDLVLHALTDREFRLVDLDDRPVAGATVTVHSTHPMCPPREIVTSGADGRVRVGMSPDDILLVRASGFATKYVESPAEFPDGTIVLRPAWRVAGTVTDVEGRPVEGAAVQLDCWWSELAVTGSDGKFSFDNLTADTCSSDGERPLVELLIRHPEFLPADKVVVPGTADADVVLHRPGDAVVRVTLVPPPEVHQDRFYLRFGHPSDVDLKAVEDPPGTFTLTGVPSGTLSFYAAGMRERGRPYVVSEAKFRIEVEPGKGHLSRTVRLLPKVVSVAMVRVQDSEGRPVHGATVWTDAPGLRLTDTDEEGIAWLWLPSPPGTPVALDVARAWSGGGMRGFAARVETKTRADFTGPVPVVTLVPGRLLTVRVTDAGGRPLPAGRSSVLVLQKQDPTGSQDSGNFADQDPAEPHTFRFRVRPERGFGIIVRLKGFGVCHRRYPPPGDRDPEVTLRMPAEAGLTGRLVTPTGRPFRDVYVITATILDGPDAPYYGASTDEVAADGRFSIAGLVQGRIRLTAFEVSRPTHSPIAETVVSLPKAGETNIGDVVVGRLPVVRGSIHDPDGRPLSGTVVTSREGPGRKVLARALTKPDGSFELATPIRPGCILEFRREGCERFELPLTAGTPDRIQAVTLTPEE